MTHNILNFSDQTFKTYSPNTNFLLRRKKSCRSAFNLCFSSLKTALLVFLEHVLHTVLLDEDRNSHQSCQTRVFFFIENMKHLFKPFKLVLVAEGWDHNNWNQNVVQIPSKNYSNKSRQTQIFRHLLVVFRSSALQKRATRIAVSISLFTAIWKCI